MSPPLSVIERLPSVWNGSYRSDKTLEEDKKKVTNIMKEEKTQKLEQRWSWRWENKHLVLSEKTKGEPRGSTGKEMEQAVFVATAKNTLDVVIERSFYIFSSIFQWNIGVKTILQWVERANRMWGT